MQWSVFSLKSSQTKVVTNNPEKIFLYTQPSSLPKELLKKLSEAFGEGAKFVQIECELDDLGFDKKTVVKLHLTETIFAGYGDIAGWIFQGVSKKPCGKESNQVITLLLEEEEVLIEEEEVLVC